MNKIYFVIGASGAGKTTAIRSIEKNHADEFQFCYFDSIGVPSNEEMIRDFGSAENWQKENTKKWVRKMKEDSLDSKPAILDGQTRPSFIKEACAENGITSYEVVLLDCSDQVRKERLIKRNHPELANEQMMNWAKYLREESTSNGYKIIDNTDLSEDQSMNMLLEILHGK